MVSGLEVTVSFEDVDLGFDATFRALKRSHNTRVEAGLFGKKMAKRGAIGEFGTKSGPLAGKGRPWLSIAADTGIPEIAKAAEVAAGKVADGGDAKEAFEPVGDVMATLAREVITNQQVGGPDLSDSWTKRKGHNRKMDGLNKGKKKMLFNITFKVFAGRGGRK